MSPHAPHHETLLQALLTGDLTEDDPQMEAMLQCPECNQRLAQYRLLVGQLDQAGREQEEVMREVATLGGVPGEDRISELVRGELARTRRSPGRRRALAWFALAAAVLIGAIALWSRGGDGGAPASLPEDRSLHGQGDYSPTGTVAEAPRTFRWRRKAQTGEAFHFYLYDLADRTEPLVTRRLTENTCELNDADLQLLEGVSRLEWWVEVVVEQTGEVIDRLPSQFVTVGS